MFTEYLDAHDLHTLLLPPGSYHPFPPRADRAALLAELRECFPQARLAEQGMTVEV